MSLLIESIKVIDGRYFNLFYHEQRMIRSLETLCGYDGDFNLEQFLSAFHPPSPGVFKCRLVYDDESREVEFIPYEMKAIGSLKIVENNRIKYEFKYTNRKAIEKLYARRENCDDVLIVRKGKVTDSSFSNIVFRRGNTWVTPWSPLLRGTMRQNLIDSNRIQTEDIGINEIHSFQSFKLINALLEFEGPEIDVSRIVF